MLGNPGENGCVKVRFPVHGGWDSRDFSVPVPLGPPSFENDAHRTEKLLLKT